MQRGLRIIGWSAATLVVVCLVLAGPVATWLEAREFWADPGVSWNAVYLVAGARAQERRIRGLTGWLEAERAARVVEPGVAGTSKGPVIWIGHDPQVGSWSRRHQRNLTSSEWALERLGAMDGAVTNREPAETRVALSGYEIRELAGIFHGTDAEMEHLGHYLRSRPGIQRLGLVTSPFHARRAYQRARVHCPASVMLGVIPGVHTWEDRAPWIVASELLKMARDAVGLSRSPGLSRRPDGSTQWTPAGMGHGWFLLTHQTTYVYTCRTRPSGSF